MTAEERLAGNVGGAVRKHLFLPGSGLDAAIRSAESAANGHRRYTRC